MPARSMPSSHAIPAMTRDFGPILERPHPLRYGERRDMLTEANRAARREIPVNGQRVWPLDVSVLMELDDHYNMRDGVSRPSRERIAANLGISDVAAISKSITRLVRAGFVVREQRGRRTIYRFRGPLYAHHLRADEGLDCDADDPTNSVLDDTVAHDTHVAGDTRQFVNSATHDTHMVSPTTPPYKNPVIEPVPEGENPAPAQPSAAPVSVRPTSTSLPRDYVLSDELRAYAVSKGIPAADVDDVFEGFCLYWWADTRKRKTDWGLTWMTWARREGAKYGRPPSATGRRRNDPDGRPESYNDYDDFRSSGKRKEGR